MSYENKDGKFAKASFNGINFPYTQISIKGGIRHHIHEYPHSPGGDVEKLGRKLYAFRFRVPAYDIPGSRLESEFQGMFPDRLRNMIALFDRQTTADLLVPSVGTMKCVATEWDGTADMAETLSGEVWNWEFIEDVDQASIVKAIPNLGVHHMIASLDALQASSLALGLKPGLFDALTDAANAILAITGEADMYSRLVAGKLEGIAQLCGKLDREVKELLDPMNHVVLEALKDVWANTVDLAQNIPGVQGGEVATFRVPTLMSIGQVATRLYGSADRGTDIMQINPIEDPFAIKAGTQLKYVTAGSGLKAA